MEISNPEVHPARARAGREKAIPRVLLAAARLLVIPAAVYAGLVALLYTSQEALLFPGRETQGEEVAAVLPPDGAELVSLSTRSGDRIQALWGPALDANGAPLSDPASAPTMLYFYGNGTWLASSVHHLERWRRLGANVMIPEYVGYGLSSGAAGEAGCYATADAAYDYLRSRPDVDPERLVLSGASLGGAVAIDLATRRRAAGLAVFMAFTSMAEVAQREFPIVPVGPFLKHRFENESKLGRIHCPVLIGHGTADALVPFGMAERLARAAGGPVTRVTIEGASHNDYFSLGSTRLDRALSGFLEPLRAKRRATARESHG